MSQASPLMFRVNKDIFNPTLYRRVVDLWFADLPSGATAPTKDIIKRWFGGGSESERTAFDSKCDSNFQSALESIGPKEFPLPQPTEGKVGNETPASIASPFIATLPISSKASPTPETSEAALGLVILLDQIPRNIFRHDKKLIFGHYDRIAVAVAHEIQAKRLNHAPEYISSAAHQVWFYMPLMHSEVLADHDEFFKAMEVLKKRAIARADDAAVKYIQITEGVEKEHRDIIERFGRYPYRNEALGRETTAEERAWIEAGGKSF